MMGHGLLELLFPQDERDAEFRREIDRLSLTGLRTATGIGIGGPLFMFLVGLTRAPGILNIFTFDRMLFAVSPAVVALAVSFIRGVRPHLRLLGLLSGVLIAFDAVFGLMRTMPDPVRAAHLANAKVIVVMLVAVAVFPLRPLHALVMGIGITAGLAAAMGTATYQSEDAGLAAIPVMSVFIVALVCTLLTTILYRQRASAYWARRAAEESFEELKRAQARLLVSENALSLGRLAAALSHEMDSPLGALGAPWIRSCPSSNRNGVSRCPTVSEKSPTASPGRRARRSSVFGRPWIASSTSPTSIAPRCAWWT